MQKFQRYNNYLFLNCIQKFLQYCYDNIFSFLSALSMRMEDILDVYRLLLEVELAGKLVLLAVVDSTLVAEMVVFRRRNHNKNCSNYYYSHYCRPSCHHNGPRQIWTKLSTNQQGITTSNPVSS